MPTVTIQGLYGKGTALEIQEFALRDLIRQVMAAVAGIQELGLESTQVKVFLQPSLYPEELRPSLMVEMIDLFDTPEGKSRRTPETCQAVAEVLKSAVASWAREHMPRCRNVEAHVFLLRLAEDGYATCDPQDKPAAAGHPGCG